MLFLLSLMQLRAEVFAQRLTLHVENKSLKDVMKEINQKTGYDFFYKNSLLKNTTPISISVENTNLKSILDVILSNQSIDYKIDDSTVILLPREKNHEEQTRTISGVVLNPAGEPIAGATIKTVGKSEVQTQSDAEGKFQFTIDSDVKELLITSIGFKENRYTIGSSNNLKIQLTVAINDLDEIVVVGFGTQKKVNLTGAVSSINFEKEAESRPITSISNVLAGLAPGLQAMQGSGMPNSDNSTLRIRGTGTLNTSTPLVLVDGMEQSFNDINPADVESISVLKDAASASIYGNRAANGVILITTKKGKNGRMDLSYRSLYSVNTPSNLIELVDNSAAYMELMNESSTNVGQAYIFNEETINKWREAEKDPNGLSETGYPNYVAYPNTDWYKEVFQQKLMNDQTLTARGATDKVNYSLSGTYLNNPGLIDGAGMKKYYLRSNLSFSINDWLTVGNRTYGYQSDVGRNSTSTALSDLGFTKVVPSIYPFYDGKYGAPEPKEEDPQSHNTLWDIQSTGGSYTYSQINTSMFADINLFKDLVYHANFDWTRYWQEDLYFDKSLGKYSFSQDQMIIAPMSSQELSSAFYTMGNKRWRVEQTLNYRKSFDIHDIGVLLGHEEMRKTQYNIDAQKTGLIDQSITDLSTATEMKSITGTNTEFASRSFFGRLNYGYNSKYLLEVNLRYDGSSRFSPETRWGWFPSVSAGWRISQESFLKDVELINELKIRGSWGKLGNNSIGNYDWQNTYSKAGYAFGNNVANGLAMTSIANRNLMWESTAISNIGFDALLFDSRLNAIIDLYNKTTDGILFRPNIYATMGNKTAPFQNIAEVSNKGVEVALSWNDIAGDFRYNIGTNFSYNLNRVSKYKGLLERGWIEDSNGQSVYTSNIGDVSTGGTNRILEGHTINEFYMLDVYKGSGNYFNADGSVNINGGPKDGMIRTPGDMEWISKMIEEGYTFYPNQQLSKTNIWYGDYIYKDINGDGVYGNSGDNDFQMLSPEPKYNFGLQAGMSWKNFDFSMNWAASMGFGIYWYRVGQNSSATVFGYAIPKSIAEDHYFYDPENPSDPRTNLNSMNPRLTRNGGSSQSEAVSTLHLENGDFLKLKNVTIGYKIPSSITQKAKIRDIRIFFSGENLLNFNNFKGMDPEMRTGVGYVTTRQYAFGLNVNF